MKVIWILLAILPTEESEAFSAHSISHSSAQRRTPWPRVRPSVRGGAFHAALEDAAEPPADPSFQSPANNNTEGIIFPRDTAQKLLLSPTPNWDAAINLSIIIASVAIVLYLVLSVDVGITRGWTPTEIAGRIPLDNWRSYNEILAVAPLKTKAITSATVYTIGDIISQRTDGVGIGELDRGRILRSLLAGLIGHGPMSHIWYDVSEDFFDNVLNLHAWWDFLPKVLLDQATWGPFWNNTYILILGMMQLQKPLQIWDDMKRTTIPLIVSGLKLWPLAHCITYGLVPVENRLLWVDFVEIIWVTILASEAGKSDSAQTDACVVAAESVAAQEVDDDDFR